MISRPLIILTYILSTASICLTVYHYHQVRQPAEPQSFHINNEAAYNALQRAQKLGRGASFTYCCFMSSGEHENPCAGESLSVHVGQYLGDDGKYHWPKGEKH